MSDTDTTKPASPSWSAVTWVWLLSIALVAVACIYVSLHTTPSAARAGKCAVGLDRVVLTESDRKLIRGILEQMDTLARSRAHGVDQVQTAADSASIAAAVKKKATEPKDSKDDAGRSTTTKPCPPALPCPFQEDAACRRHAVMHYLSDRLRNWETADSTRFARLAQLLSDEALQEHLEHASFTVYSYFWLTGWPALGEVVFWTFFGVMCNLLYSIYETRRRYVLEKEGTEKAATLDDDPVERGFDAKEMPNHLAKVVFAPFVTVIIIIGYYAFGEKGGPGAMETSTGMIVMSYLLGFYSSRAMALLARIRDVFLPLGSASADLKTKDAKPVATEMETLLTLEIAEAIATAHADKLEELNNALDKAEVHYTLRGTTAVKTAARVGDDQESTYLIKALPGVYEVIAKAGIPAGINLKGVVTVDITSQRSMKLTMDVDKSNG